MRLRRHAVLLGLVGAGTLVPPVTRAAEAVVPATAQPAKGTAVFDPNRHMRVSEVKPGMSGFGLSVFSGTKVERFEVEVISVLHKFNPKTDVVLIRCRGQNLEHTGAVAGMSGSPVYLRDENGKDRMIGAFAYGWPLSKDPVAGVQPIEYMLDIPLGSASPGTGDGKPVAGEGAGGERKPAGAEARGRWSIDDAMKAWDLYASGQRGGAQPLDAKGPLPKAQGAMRLEPLATPLMTSGISPKLLETFGPVFAAQGLTPLQAGGGSSKSNGKSDAQLEPGSVLAVPLLVGDMDMTAIGTATEVIDGKVYGFGHPFNNEGKVTLPMGPGSIDHVVASISTSFKLGSITEPAGTITADRSVGIAGRIGASPEMVPIDLRVTYADGSADEKYHFDGVKHPRFTPLLAGMAIMSALGGTNDLPQYNTVDYEIDLQFSNGKTIKLSDTVANAADRDLFRFIGMPLLTAADNPFERVLVSKVSGTVKVSNEVRLAQITEVNLPRSKYRPGETLKAYVEFKKFRGGEGIVPVEMELPKDLPEGNYQLVISDWTKYMQDEQASKPFRFTGETVDELFDALRDFTSIRQNAIYLRLVRAADGVAIGRTAMPKLPSSRRQMLLGAGRSGTTRFISSATRAVPMDNVMQGAAEFVITIDDDASVDVGESGAPMRAESKPQAPTVIPDAAAAAAPGQPPAPAPPKPPKPEPSPMPNE
jgi:hypothetical protein